MTKMTFKEFKEINKIPKSYSKGDALILAAEINDVALMKCLIENGASVNYQNSHGNTPLIRAVRHDNIEATRLLIESGSNINLPNKSGNTALILSSYSKAETLNLLIGKGADINWQNNNGETVLMEEAWGRIERVELLISKGADVSLKNRDGFTAEQIATQRNQSKIAGVLKAKEEEKSLLSTVRTTTTATPRKVRSL